MIENFNKYFIDIIKNHYFDFKGKMDARTFSLFFINWFIVYLLLIVCCFFVTLSPVFFNIKISSVFLAISTMMTVLLTILLLIPCFFACIRRQKDIDEKKWFLYFLLLLIPFIGNIVYIVVLFVMSSEKNKETIKQIE